MNKIGLIIQREYLNRVRKKSFIIMTLIGPILMAAMFVVPIWLATMEDEEIRKIAVIDETNSFEKALTSNETTIFDFRKNENIDSLKANLNELGYYAILLIPKSDSLIDVQLYSDQKSSISVLNMIRGRIENEIEKRNLRERGIEENVLEEISANIKVDTYTVKEGKEEKSSTGVAMAIGFIGAFMIYMFVFIYGAQVMRGVIEEKTSRIVEVIISSVRPFQLMMGKILGIALVALTQFFLWIILTAGIIFVAQGVIMPDKADINQEQLAENMASDPMTNELVNDATASGAEDILNTLKTVPIAKTLLIFLFYFLGGYLLYAALFGAIGAAVDNETDTQQFMLPITIPLILAIVVAQTVVKNPESALSFWFSIIPFTSPVIMMIRVPFENVATWELLLSMFLLIVTFIGTIWVGAKIYRTGILMYGKKVDYKELWKWLRYKG